MPSFKLEDCVRPNILKLQPYRCARDDYKDDGTNILLDANENAYGPCVQVSEFDAANSLLAPKDYLGLHRYPDPHQESLKRLFCSLRSSGVSENNLGPENLVIGVGSDEIIDAVLRCFCVPGQDRILTCPPTYGMYSVSAQVNDVSIVQVPLDVDPTAPKSAFGLDVPAILDTLDREPHIKVAYFCSPGNPTGALLAKEDIRAILEHSTWNGIVVVDEAYVDFAGEGASLAEWVTQWPNLLVMQTLSKTFGMAGIRIGVAFTSPPIARLLNNIKAPYNISSPTSILATHALSEASRKVMHENRKRILKQRDRLLEELPRIPGVGRRRGGTDANFLLFEMVDANENPDNVTALAVYEGLARTKGVVVRFRGKEHGCLGCLRFTVGTEEEVTRLLSALRKSLEEVRLRTSIAPKDEEKAEVEANRVVA